MMDTVSEERLIPKEPPHRERWRDGLAGRLSSQQALVGLVNRLVEGPWRRRGRGAAIGRVSAGWWSPRGAYPGCRPRRVAYQAAATNRIPPQKPPRIPQDQMPAGGGRMHSLGRGHQTNGHEAAHG